MPDPSAPRHRVATHDGVRLHVLDWGHGDLAAVCIPGITANAQAFAGVAACLAPRRVVAIDLRGRGESDTPDDGYDVETHAADVIAVLDALDVRRTDIIGWSLGGKVALALAVAAPHRVARVVALDPPVTTSPAAQASLRRFWARLVTTYPSIDAYLEVARAAADRYGGWSPTVEAYLRADVETGSDGTVRHRIAPWVPERELEAEPRTPTLGYAARVEQPTLVLRSTRAMGTEGDAVLPSDEAAALMGALPHARLEEIADVDHFSMLLADPTPVCPAIRAFLAA